MMYFKLIQYYNIASIFYKYKNFFDKIEIMQIKIVYLLI